MKAITDPIERIVADALRDAEITFIHESEDDAATKGLDFYLPGRDVFVECKAYHTERTGPQMARVDNIIVIQGKRAAMAFAMMLMR